MTTPDVPATYTVKLYSRNGLAKVVGVTDQDIQDRLEAYIHIKGGETSNDWYWFFKDSDLLDIVGKAKELDSATEVFNVVLDYR